MPPVVAGILDRARELWAGWSPRVRLTVVAAAGALAITAGALYAAASLFVDYQILFSNLSQEDAAAVTDALRGARIPFRVGDGQVSVPASRVHEWRLKLASQGVPQSSNVGFEIFDKNQFGLTDFAQRLNFQRALQGELARTIGQLKEVQQARVHLALPAPRVFSSQDRPASASVVLRLRPGAMLRPDQVRGIVHLVTSSVEGLSPDRVTVVDSTGRMLASGLDRVGGLSSNQMEARTAIEIDIERRIQTLLDPIVGSGRSAVRVSALVNFDQIERTEERFDPKPLVRTQSKSTETLQGSTAQPMVTPAPAPGERPTPPQQATALNRTQRESEQTTYEIARTVEKTVVAPGDVKRLSVAVLLDVPLVGGQRVPRADEELQRIKRLVASAAGLRDDRKDELEVQQVPFDPTIGVSGEAPTKDDAPAIAHRWPLTWGVGAVLAIAIVLLVVWRARRRRLALESAVGAAFDGHNVLAEPQETPATPEFDLATIGADENPLKRQVLKAAQEHPDEVAQLLRAWMFRRKAMVS
jgi:flagellar M-ring protein FliF